MTGNPTLVVIFSKDRPLQLDAVLRSLQRHCSDIASVRVQILYRASSSRLSSYYRRLVFDYAQVDFVPESDFRRDLLILLRGCASVLFLVDDSIFVRPFSIAAIRATLDQNPDALGYSLRLGQNTNFCYMLGKAQALPAFGELADHVLKYRWVGAGFDFAYPLEVSSSLYRGAQIRALFENLQFKNPNTLEDAMSRSVSQFESNHPCLLCSANSLAFSIPVNKVQEVCDNRSGTGSAYSAESLALAFAEGKRIDVAALDGYSPKSCHEEVELSLQPIARSIPLVTIVTPCFKQAQYLPEAVASVVAQSFTDWELIIVNDGSPDATSEVAHSLIKKYPKNRIRLLEKRNGGLAHARNAAMAIAEGAYILPLDADDLIAPDFLAKTVALLQQDSAIDIAYTDIEHFGAEEKTIQAAEFEFEKLCQGNQLNYCSLYRREVWEQVGGYNPNMIWGYEDWNFWVGAGENGFVARRIPGALLRYRVKSASMYTEALTHDRECRARIVFHYPKFYTPGQFTETCAIWGNPELPRPPGAPKVSVIIPTFNRPSRLAEALQSVCAQTFKDFEIIVVNDNGIDAEHVIRRHTGEAETTYLRRNSSPGIPGIRNRGLRFARGKYVIYLDDDDIFLPDHLQTLVTALESSQRKSAYTDSYCAHENATNGAYTISDRKILDSTDWNEERILIQNYVPTLCFMFEKSSAIAVGGFDEQMTTHEDWDFWIRLCQLGAPLHIAKATCEFRTRHDGTSTTSARRADFLRTLKLIYKKYRCLAAGKKAVRRGQRDFRHGLEKELRRQNPPAWKRWIQTVFKT